MRRWTLLVALAGLAVAIAAAALGSSGPLINTGRGKRTVTKRARLGCFAASTAIVLLLGVATVIYQDDRSERQGKRSVADFEAELLAATPLGTDIGEVQKYVERRWGEKAAEPATPSDQTEEFHSTINVVYGDFSIPGSFFGWIRVEAHWWFGQDGRLAKIVVDKYGTGP
jgi:hypothetical protein